MNTEQIVTNIAVPCVYKGNHYPGICIWPGADAITMDAPCMPGVVSHAYDFETVFGEDGEPKRDPETNEVLKVLVRNEDGELRAEPRKIVKFTNANVGQDFAVYADQCSCPDIGTEICHTFLQIRPV